MGALQRDDGGCWRYLIRFGGTRSPVRLGHDLTEKQARTAGGHIDAIADAKESGTALTPATAAWLTSIGDKLHARLAALKLTEPRAGSRPVTLAELWDRFVAARTVKPATAAVHARVRKSMESHFGAARDIASIGAEHADGWIKALADDKRKLAVATRSKLAYIAKALFRRAVLWELLPRSPFASIKPGPQTNPKRQAYMTLADLDRIIAACPSDKWRCLFALARLAGVRVPSEVCGLTWGDVNFETGRMLVRSPKTEHHADGATRIVPMVPRLRAILLDVFTRAPEGTVYVVPELQGGADTNLRTHGLRILEKAKVAAVPKLFVNLRASRATDWASEHGGATAAKWLGHSATIALKHYHQVREIDFAAATGIGARSGATEDTAGADPVPPAVPKGRETPGGTGKLVPVSIGETPSFPDDSRTGPNVPDSSMGATGLEPVTSAM